MNKYNWKRMNYSSGKKRLEKLQIILENTSTIALDVLYAKKEEKTYPAYILKADSNFEKKIFFFDHLKRRRITLSSSKKIIYIIKRNNVKT